MSGFATEGIIVGLFHSFLQKGEVGLEQSMKVRDFVFDYVEGLFYKWHTVSLNRFGSHIDSPKCLKNKKATINPQNKNDDMIIVFCNLKKHPTEIIDCEKKEMLPLTKKQENNAKNKTFTTHASKNLIKSLMKIKTIVRSRITLIAPRFIRGLLVVSVI